MPKPFTKKLADLVATILGREPTGDAVPPRTGTDRSSMRHMLALFIGTLAIMAVGLLVAFLSDGESEETSATPTVVVAPTASGDE